MKINGEDHKKMPQFIVNEGIIYNKKDIMRLLWDLGHVIYLEAYDEKILNKGKGFIMQISYNSEDPTIFLGGRIYINVNSFDCLKVKKIKDSLTMYELYNEDRIIKMIPDIKKQPYPPLRHISDAMIGLGVMGEGDMPDSIEGTPDGSIDEWMN